MTAFYYSLLALCLLAWVAGVVLFIDMLRVARRRRNRLIDRAAWDSFTRNWR